MDERKAVSVEVLWVEMDAALGALEERSQEARADRSAECAVLDRVNQAQKEIDKWVAELRNDAPRDSDWGSGSDGPEARRQYLTDKTEVRR